MEQVLEFKDLEQIRDDIIESKKIISKNIIYIGLKLIEVKKYLSGESFDKWVKREVNFSRSTAYNFIKVAQEFDEKTVQTLGQSKIFELLKIEKSERKKFMNKSYSIDKKEKTISEMSVRELKRIVREENDKKNKDECKKEIYTELLAKSEKIEQEIERLKKEKNKIDNARFKEAAKLKSDFIIKEVESETALKTTLWATKYDLNVYRKVYNKEDFILNINYIYLKELSCLNKYLNENKYIFKCIDKKDIDILISKILEYWKSTYKINMDKREKEHEFNRRKSYEDYVESICNKSDNTFLKEIINTGYKTLAKKYHPDINGGDSNKMVELNKAKEILLNNIN